jgi:ribosomal protein S18 acetylase RimI-like enzyme
MTVSYDIAPARTPDDLAAMRDLIQEFLQGVGIEIAIQGFAAELPHFPGDYAPPRGELLLASDEAGEALGCICLHPLAQPGACEIKRLYVRPAARGLGLGRALVAAMLDRATALGYREAMLDTLPWMTSAIAIYRAQGFTEIPPYWNNIVPGILFFGRKLPAD